MGFLQDKTAGLIKPRTLVLLILLVAPILLYSLVGAIAIWQIGWMFWVWWLGPIFWGAAWVVSRFWNAPLPIDERFVPAHWTPRDEAAALIVRKFQEDAELYSVDQLTDPQFYLNLSQTIGLELAQIYHPETTDPISERTLAEILAACRLVADDLEDLLLTSVPGSQMLTVRQWRKLGEAPALIRQATKAFWAAKVLLNPFNIAQWGTSKVTNEQVTSNLQTELLASLYIRFVKQLGFYLIEMNSGRLRAGADTYRKTFAQRPKSKESTGSQNPAMDSTQSEPGFNSTHPSASDRQNSTALSSSPSVVQSPSATFAVMGQRGSGKSRLIQALLGQPSSTVAETDDSALTSSLPPEPTLVIHPYDLKLDEDASIRLLDTPGYDPVATGRKLNQPVQFAAENSQCIMLVLNAQSAQWESDRELIERVQEHFQARPNLKPPAIIAIVTNAGVTNAIGTSAKGTNAGVTDVGVKDGDLTDSEKVATLNSTVERVKQHFGILVDEMTFIGELSLPGERMKARLELLPKILECLDSARAAALLASFENSISKDRFRVLLNQAKTSGKKLISSWLKHRKTDKGLG